MFDGDSARLKSCRIYQISVQQDQNRLTFLEDSKRLNEVYMSTTPETADFTEWQQVVDLLRQAALEQKDDVMLKLLLTPDEREALLARVNILHELMNGQRSQRKISELLGVGVATITRGSNELKHQSDDTKEWLASLLKKQQQ